MYRLCSHSDSDAVLAQRAQIVMTHIDVICDGCPVGTFLSKRAQRVRQQTARGSWRYWTLQHDVLGQIC